MHVRAVLRCLTLSVFLAVALLLVAPASGGTSVSASPHAVPPPPTAVSLAGRNPATLPTQSPIKHVIIVIQENHAFDNYFSDFPGVFGMDPGGVPQPSTQTGVNYYGNQYGLTWNYTQSSSGSNQSSDSPNHDQEGIRGNIDNGSMDGYYYTDGQVSDGEFPYYIVANELGLGEEYGVGDNFFHDFSGPTLPNRFYYYADSSGGITGDTSLGASVSNVTIQTLPQELSRLGISWGDFDGDYNYNNYSSCDPLVFLSYDWPAGPSCYFFWTLVQLMPSLYFNFTQKYAGQLGLLQPFDNLYTDLFTNNLPSVSWYTQDWLNGTEHPGTIEDIAGGNVTTGQAGLTRLVQAVQGSPYWNSTAIFISYDEAGGFFDHVPPPQITSLGDGVRMPFIVISPYAKEGYVSHAYYTPSSLLHFVEWNWNIPALGPLDAMSNIPLDFFNFSAPPRAALPATDFGGTSHLTAFPWPLQPVSSAYLTTPYKPALVTNGSVSWAYQTKNVVINSPAETSDGTRLYEAGMDGFLRALNPTTGAELWQATLGTSSRSTPALLPNDGVLVSTLHGDLIAYSSSGSLLWNISVGAPIYTGLTEVHGNFYGAMTNGSMFGVSPNGTVLWIRSVSTDRFYAPPAFDPSTGFLLGSESPGGVVAVNLSGSIQWTASIPGGVYSTGAVDAGTLYVTSTDGGLYPITISTGVVGTPASLPGDSVTTSVIIGNTLYAGNNTGLLAAYSLPSLTQTWAGSLYGDVAGSPVEWNGDLWVGSGGGYVYEFPLGGGAPIQVLHSNSSLYASMTAGPTGLYWGEEDGNVYAIVPKVAPTLGWVAGQVTDASTSAAIPGASVTFTSPTGPASGTTGATGDFNLTLTAGSYAYFVNATGFIGKTGTLSVSASKTTTDNVALTPNPSAPHPGWAAGSVSNYSSGQGLNGIAIKFTSSVGPGSGSSGTGGAYNVSLSPGSYVVYVNATHFKPFLGAVTVASGRTTTYDIALVPTGSSAASPGWAIGTVSNASSPGSAIAGANVVFVAPSRSVTATTGATGAYNASLYPTSYEVFVNETGYVDYASTTPLTISSSKATSFDIALNPTPHVPPNGAISGTVYANTVSSANALGSIELLFMPGDQTVISTSSGTYSVSLAPGTYSVFVNATGYSPYVMAGIIVEPGTTTTQSIILMSTSTCSSNCGSNSGSGGSSGLGSNWLLLALIIAAVAAAAVLLAVVALKRKKGGPPPEGEAAAGAAASASAEWAEPAAPSPDPGVGSQDPSTLEPPPEAAPNPGPPTA